MEFSIINQDIQAKVTGFADNIEPETAGNGVAVDGVVMKDGNVLAPGYTAAALWAQAQAFYALSDAPGFVCRDSECAVSRDNASFIANATDTGDGTEDIDIRIRQMVNGVLVDALFLDADGWIQFTRDTSIEGNLNLTAGYLTQKPASSVTPADNGELVVEATSNTQLTFKLKGSDGTVRSGSITLS